jgi:integrase/recombinase XerD
MIKIQTAINNYLIHCRIEKRLSEKTIKAYQTDLLQFQKVLVELKLSHDVREIKKESIRTFLAILSDLKPKSLKRKMASLKAFFNFLEFEDHISVNPFRKMRLFIKEEKRLPNVLTVHEISKILEKAYRVKVKYNKKKSYSYIMSIRDIVIIELLFSTGARVSEIAGIKTGNINLKTGDIIIKGKGNKERVIQICNQEVLEVAREYYSLNSGLIKESGGFFLTNRHGNGISDQSIRRIVKRIKDNAGINKHITPHMFRHSFASLLLENDVDIKYIQTLLGHSSITTTQIYTHVNISKQRSILEAKHPRRELSMMDLVSE